MVIPSLCSISLKSLSRSSFSFLSNFSILFLDITQQLKKSECYLPNITISQQAINSRNGLIATA